MGSWAGELTLVSGCYVMFFSQKICRCEMMLGLGNERKNQLKRFKLSKFYFRKSKMMKHNDPRNHTYIQYIYIIQAHLKFTLVVT